MGAIRPGNGLGVVVVLVALALSVGCGGAKKKGSLCQDDSGCTGGGLCLGGTCVALTACTNTTECGSGVCYDGHCWDESCSADNPCPDYLQCLDGYCVRQAGNTTTDTSTEDQISSTDTGTEEQCTTNADCVGKISDLGECEAAVCQGGNCVKGYKPLDAPCSDGNSCTEGDKCDANGVCQPGSNKCECQTDAECAKLDDECNSGSCDLLTNSCVKLAIKEAQSCEDGDACTTGETCQNGVCTGGTNPCVDAADACKKTAVCTPGVGDAYTCDYSAQDKLPCDDKSSCTTSDSCDKGACIGTGNACIESSNPCRVNALCQKTSDTTHTCDYSPDNGTSCNDNLECTDPDACDGVTGTCRGALKPLLTGCTLPDQSPGVCGFHGDCTSVETSLFKTPAGSSSYQFRAICKVENDTIAYPVANFITDDPNNSYGTMNVAIHKLQAGTLTPGPTIDTAGISGDLTTRFHCLGDKLLYARVDQRTVPTWETVRGLGLALWDSANQSWVLENDTTNKSLLDDKYKKWHDDGARYVYEIWSAARLGDQYLLTIDGSSLDTRSLVSCVDSNSGPNPDTCTSVELTNLVSAVQNPYFRTPNLLAFPNGSGGVDVMLLSLEPYESSAKNRSWTFTAYDGQTFTTSCKGDDRTKPCHNVGEYPSTYEQVPLGESVGFRSMAGSSFNHIYVVGQPEFPIFDPDLEKTVTRQTPCDGANAGYTCVTGTCVGGYCEDGPSDRIGSIAFFDGANWSSLTVPSKVLLREAAGKLVGFYDYVFDQALYLASRQTLLLAGHYRACIHATDASKCFVAGETITLSGRAFLLAYDEATQTFSPMLPLGAARTADCCDGTQTDCGAKARCTRETIKALLSGFGAALGLVAPTPTSHELYVLENRYAPVMCSVSEDCGTNGFCYLGVCDDYQYKRMQPLFHSLLSSEP